MLSKKEQGKLTELIQERLVLLTEQIPLLKESAEPVSPDNAIGRLSRLEAMQAQSIAKSNLQHAENERKQLQVILSKIAHEAFGLCETCEASIPLQRIVLVPTSRLCAKCAKAN